MVCRYWRLAVSWWQYWTWRTHKDLHAGETYKGKMPGFPDSVREDNGVMSGVFWRRESKIQKDTRSMQAVTPAKEKWADTWAGKTQDLWHLHALLEGAPPTKDMSPNEDLGGSLTLNKNSEVGRKRVHILSLKNKKSMLKHKNLEKNVVTPIASWVLITFFFLNTGGI